MPEGEGGMWRVDAESIAVLTSVRCAIAIGVGGRLFDEDRGCGGPWCENDVGRGGCA